jgi:hypothetical protein
MYVVVTSPLGNGVPDLLVRMDKACPHCKRKSKQNIFVEVKEIGGKLTPDEEKWHDEHPGMSTIWMVIRQGNKILVEENGNLLQFDVSQKIPLLREIPNS